MRRTRKPFGEQPTISYEIPVFLTHENKPIKRVFSFSPYPPGYPDHRFAVWVRSFGLFLLGAAGGLLSYRDYVTKREEAERTARIQVETFTRNREMDRFRSAASLVPHIHCKGDEQTRVALQLLNSTIPEYAKLFTETLQAQCPEQHPLITEQLKSLQYESARAELGAQLTQALAVAWLYKGYNQNDRAAEYFERASNLITLDHKNDVDFEELSRARDARNDGRIKEAADHYANAFRKVRTP